MQKPLLSLLFLFFSFSAFSQFVFEDFENTTGPEAVPSRNWNLESGNWMVFDNGVGSSRWNIVTTSSVDPLVYQGSNSAFIGNESNIGIGNTSRKFLVLPLTATSYTGNSELHFYTRTFSSGNQGTKYKIHVAPETMQPDNVNNYVLLKEWTEDEISSPFNIYQEKVVNFGAMFAGQPIYIIFEKEYTQTTATPNDDRWYIDNVSMEYSCSTSTCYSTLELIPFVDVNNNGTKDLGESAFNNGYFSYQVNDTGPTTSTYPNIYGFSHIIDNNHTDSYDISFNINNEFQPYYSCPTNFSNQTTPVNGNTQLYFPVVITQPITDAQVLLISSNARAGGFSGLCIAYKNNGYQTITNGTITFTKDPNTTIYSLPAGASATPNGFTYTFSNLLPGERRLITFTLQIPPIPAVTIGQMLNFSASIQISNDAITSNNTSPSSVPVVASYDPNDITESHGSKIVHSTFTSTDYLYYTVRFENTGNAYAETIRVENLLDADLNEATFEMLDSSHNVDTKRVGSQVTWKFDEINLPPTLTNPESSHGFVNYRIKPKAGYAIGDIIPATASIYFDTNPAIVTDTFNTEFVQRLGKPAFDFSTVSLHPNPANNQFAVTNSGTEKISKLVIYEITGKKICTISSNSSESIPVDTSQFAKGIYLIELTSENDAKVTKKLIVK